MDHAWLNVGSVVTDMACPGLFFLRSAIGSVNAQHAELQKNTRLGCRFVSRRENVFPSLGEYQKIDQADLVTFC